MNKNGFIAQINYTSYGGWCLLVLLIGFMLSCGSGIQEYTDEIPSSEGTKPKYDDTPPPSDQEFMYFSGRSDPTYCKDEEARQYALSDAVRKALLYIGVEVDAETVNKKYIASSFSQETGHTTTNAQTKESTSNIKITFDNSVVGIIVLHDKSYKRERVNPANPCTRQGYCLIQIDRAKLESAK